MLPDGRLHRFFLAYSLWSITFESTLTWWATDDYHLRPRKFDWEIQLPRWPWRFFCRGRHADYYGECVFCHAPIHSSPYFKRDLTTVIKELAERDAEKGAQ